DFGQKKSDLVDALSMLTANEEFLKRYDDLDKRGLAPVFTILNQRRDTEKSRIDVKSAENRLRTAKMTDEEIQALERELVEVSKKLPTEWPVRVSSDPNGTPLPGEIVHISPIIDPAQHTALALGYVDNPDARMRGAQLITATVPLPAPEDTVAIPTSALVEDG